jgi:hypothetical protein
MREDFERFLIVNGYKTQTPSGNPSTVYDYIKRIDKVCEWENLTWNSLSNQIAAIVRTYDAGGAKEDLGKTSHNAVINALKRFAEYVHAR